MSNSVRLFLVRRHGEQVVMLAFSARVSLGLSVLSGSGTQMGPLGRVKWFFMSKSLFQMGLAKAVKH